MSKFGVNVLKSIYDTEKTNALRSLKDKDSNKSIKRFNQEKHVFLVDTKATKVDVRKAVEIMFDVKVDSVNTILNKPKVKRARVKCARKGSTNFIKKAIVTLKENNSINIDFSNDNEEAGK